jgi:hypothetical protein
MRKNEISSLVLKISERCDLLSEIDIESENFIDDILKVLLDKKDIIIGLDEELRKIFVTLVGKLEEMFSEGEEGHEFLIDFENSEGDIETGVVSKIEYVNSNPVFVLSDGRTVDHSKYEV